MHPVYHAKITVSTKNFPRSEGRKCGVKGLDQWHGLMVARMSSSSAGGESATYFTEPPDCRATEACHIALSSSMECPRSRRFPKAGYRQARAIVGNACDAYSSPPQRGGTFEPQDIE